MPPKVNSAIEWFSKALLVIVPIVLTGLLAWGKVVNDKQALHEVNIKSNAKDIESLKEINKQTADNIKDVSTLLRDHTMKNGHPVLMERVSRIETEINKGFTRLERAIKGIDTIQN